MGNAFEAMAHDMAGVLGGEQQHRPGMRGCILAQAGSAGGDRDGDVEGKKGFTAFRLAAKNADRLFCPEVMDQPPLLQRPFLKVGRVMAFC